MPVLGDTQSALLSQDMLLAGVIDELIKVDRIFEVLPFMDIEGNSLAYNRETVAGNVETLDIGDTITAKTPATYVQVTTPLTTILGDAETNGLVQATRSNINDQRATAIASKSREVGRKFSDLLINGDKMTTSSEFDGLVQLVDAGQSIAPDAGANTPLTFLDLDRVLDKVIDKNGQVDFLIMSDATLRAYMELLRGLGGASINEVVQLPSGAQVPAYRATPIFRNQYIPEDRGLGMSTLVLAGTFDDGTGKFGISGMNAMGAAGIRVETVGAAETQDAIIDRIKWYTALANFHTKGLAMLDTVLG